MEKIINFRRLAENKYNKEGKMIIPNTIFRSGIIKFASKNDIRTLKEHQIEYIYDFRGTSEREQLGELNPDDFITKHYDILANVSSNHNIFNGFKNNQMLAEMISLYQEVLPNALNYGAVIKAILKQEKKAFLFHCSSGKDRTGVFGIILMFIFDFDLAIIKEEYLLIEARSIAFMREHFKDLFKLEETVMIEPLITVYEEYFDTFIEAVINKYGSINQFLIKLGITKEVKAKLKELYLA